MWGYEGGFPSALVTFFSEAYLTSHCSISPTGGTWRPCLCVCRGWVKLELSESVIGVCVCVYVCIRALPLRDAVPDSHVAPELKANPIFLQTHPKHVSSYQPQHNASNIFLFSEQLILNFRPC